MAEPGSRRLLFVANSTRFFTSHRLNIARAARAAGYDVHLAAPLDASATELAEAGVTLHTLAFSRGGLNPAADAREIVALYRVYRRVRPDIVHHVHAKPIAYGPAVARAARVPAVVNAVTGLGYAAAMPGGRARAARFFQALLYRAMRVHRNQRVIVQNPADARLFRRCLGARADEVVVLGGSGVDVHRFRPVPEPVVPAVLFAGRLLATKGVREFVAAARSLRERGITARFIVAGDVDPPNPASVSPAEVAAWAADGAVELPGWRTDMPCLLAETTVACLPSYREGLPKALVEAAACGRALVATDVPGCREVVRDGWNGWLVPLGDQAALEAAITAALADPGRRAEMGRNGRALVLENFQEDLVMHAQLELYETLLERVPR